MRSRRAAGCGSSSSDPAKPSPADAPRPPSTRRSASGPGTGKPPVTIGTKNFTEELILGELYAQALRAKGYSVNAAGRTSVPPKWSLARWRRRRSTATRSTRARSSSVLGHDSRPPANARAGLRARRRVRARARRDAARDGSRRGQGRARHRRRHTPPSTTLSSLGDLAAARLLRDARRGRPSSGPGPPDCVGLEQVYGVHDAAASSRSRSATQYEALRKGGADVVAVFTTDGELSQGGYKLLQRPAEDLRLPERDVRRPPGRAGARGARVRQTIDTVSAKLRPRRCG